MVAMIRSLLVPLDGSAFAESAIPMAVDVARRASAELHLLAVYEPVTLPAVPFAESPPTTLRTDAERKAGMLTYLDGVAKRTGTLGSGRVLTRLADGVAGPTIAAWLNEHPVDLMVMSTHGRGPISRFWLGSVADYVIRHASVPVLLNRPLPDDSTPPPPIRSILVPVDGSERSEAVVPIATAIAGLYGAHLTLFRAVAPPVGVADFAPSVAAPVTTNILNTLKDEAEAQVARLAARVEADGTGVATAVEVGASAAAAILERLDDEHYDLVAMSTRGAGGVQRAIVGSVADKVIRAAVKPILVMHAAQSGLPGSSDRRD